MQPDSLVPYTGGTDPLVGDEFNKPLGVRFFERHDFIYFRDFNNGLNRRVSYHSLRRSTCHDHGLVDEGALRMARVACT